VRDAMHVAVETSSLMLHAMSASFAAYLAMQCVTCGISLVVPDRTQGIDASPWAHLTLLYTMFPIVFPCPALPFPPLPISFCPLHQLASLQAFCVHVNLLLCTALSTPACIVDRSPSCSMALLCPQCEPSAADGNTGAQGFTCTGRY